MTMIHRLLAGMLIAAALGIAPNAAEAIPALSLIWQATGTPTITVAPSSTIVANLVVASDAVSPTNGGLSGVFASIEFDPAELQAISGHELSRVCLPHCIGNSMSPVETGVTIDNTNGLVEGFDEATLGTGLFETGGSRTLGSITFHVSSAGGGPGDIDVIASFQNAGVDAITYADGAFTTTAMFNGASVVPEPATATLVIAAIAGLGCASRKSRG